MHLRLYGNVIVRRQGTRVKRDLWFCGGSTQRFRRSLRKWPEVYTCALVCASISLKGIAGPACVYAGECVVERVREWRWLALEAKWEKKCVPCAFWPRWEICSRKKLTLSLISFCLWRRRIAALPSHGRAACVAATCSSIFREVTSGYAVGSPRT